MCVIVTWRIRACCSVRCSVCCSVRCSVCCSVRCSVRCSARCSARCSVCCSVRCNVCCRIALVFSLLLKSVTPMRWRICVTWHERPIGTRWIWHVPKMWHGSFTFVFYICVYIHIYTYVYMHICVDTNTKEYTWYNRMHMSYQFKCIYVYMCVSMYILTYVYTHMYIYTNTKECIWPNRMHMNYQLRQSIRTLRFFLDFSWDFFPQLVSASAPKKNSQDSKTKISIFSCIAKASLMLNWLWVRAMVLTFENLCEIHCVWGLWCLSVCKRICMKLTVCKRYGDCRGRGVCWIV